LFFSIINQSIISYFSVVVIEEPDEEPKVYEQQVNNENIDKSPFSQQFPLISSCSTIHSNKPRTNKMKYQRQNRKSPSYFRHFEPPPRFQKENNFHNSPNLNSYWVFYLKNLKKNIYFFLCFIL